MLARPADGRTVEVDRRREHRVPLDGVEQIGMAVEQFTQACWVRKEGMRRHHQTGLALPEPGQIVEALYGFGPAPEVQQKHVLSVDRALDTGNQDDASLPRVALELADIELSVMKRDRQRLVAELSRTIDEL